MFGFCSSEFWSFNKFCSCMHHCVESQGCERVVLAHPISGARHLHHGRSRGKPFLEGPRVQGSPRSALPSTWQLPRLAWSPTWTATSALLEGSSSSSLRGKPPGNRRSFGSSALCLLSSLSIKITTNNASTITVAISAVVLFAFRHPSTAFPDQGCRGFKIGDKGNPAHHWDYYWDLGKGGFCCISSFIIVHAISRTIASNALIKESVRAIRPKVELRGWIWSSETSHLFHIHISRADIDLTGERTDIW